jgi:Protein of unknown function (DUF3137)
MAPTLPRDERPAIRPLPVLFDGGGPQAERGNSIVTTEAAADAPPRPEFLALGAFYKAELEPWLESQEGRRRKARLLRWLIIGGGLPLLAVCFFFVLTGDWSEFWLFVIFVLAIVVVAVDNIPISRLQSDVKKFVMEKLAGFFSFSYAAQPDFPDAPYFTDLRLLPIHDKRNFEDGLEGEINGVPFRMVDVHLTQRRKSGKNHKDVTVFRGLLLCLPRPATGEDAVAVWRSDVGQSVTGKGWGEVSVGDSTFDGTYAVHSDSAETARRLLDRETRRAFAALDGREDVEEVRLGITHDRLLLAFNLGTDSFEAGKMNRALADPNRVQEMVELFALPFDAVEGFKLRPPAAAPAMAGGVAATSGSA